MASNCCNRLRISGSVQGNFKCTWNVEKFSTLDSEVGKCHRSETFKVQDKRMELSLVLYPGGETENSRGYVSFFAIVKSEMKDLLLKYNISLSNTEDDILFSLESKDWIVLTTKGFGNSNAIQVQDLLSELVDDTLIVALDVTYCSTYIKDGVGIHHYAETTPMVKIVDDFDNLRISKKGTDSKLNGIPYHSAVLGARLGSQPEKGFMTFDEENVVDSLMAFIYSGTVRQLNIDLALELIQASITYKMSDLRTYCSNYLIPLLDRDNVCKILSKADDYQLEKLRIHAMKYLLTNLSKEDFEVKSSIYFSQHELVREIMEEFDKKSEQSKLTA